SGWAPRFQRSFHPLLAERFAARAHGIADAIRIEKQGVSYFQSYPLLFIVPVSNADWNSRPVEKVSFFSALDVHRPRMPRRDVTKLSRVAVQDSVNEREVLPGCRPERKPPIQDIGHLRGGNYLVVARIDSGAHDDGPRRQHRR